MSKKVIALTIHDSINSIPELKKRCENYVNNLIKISYISKAEFLKTNSKFDLATFKFLMEIDKNDPNHLTIIKDDDLKLSNEAINEAIKRVKYLYNITEHLTTSYKPPYNPKDLAYDENLAQYPYLLISENNMPRLWGFVKEPQQPLWLSGQNFIEKSQFGLMTNPQPLYEDYSFGSSYGDNLEKIRVPKASIFDRENQRRIHFLEKIFLDVAKRKNKKIEDLKILDVGCNTGNALQVLNYLDKYKHLYGIDIDKKSINLFKELIKIDKLDHIKAAEIDFLSPKIKEELVQKLDVKQFDVLIFSATIEHLINPELACKHFSEILAPGGALILCSVPDIESVRAQFKQSYGDYQKPTHYYFFSKQSLKELGNKNGLEFVPLPELLPCFSKLDFLYEEVFPSLKNGKWHFFDKPLPENIKFENLFLKNTPPNLNIFYRDPNFKCYSAIVNFRYFKNYEKNVANYELIYKEFLLNSLNKPNNLTQYISELKEDLFNLFIFDKPKEFNYKTVDELNKFSLALLIKNFGEKVGNFCNIDGYWVKK